MKQKLLTITLLVACLSAFAGDVEQYFAQYRAGKSDFALQEKILSDNGAAQLVAALQPFYADSTALVRSRAYYLTCLKGRNATSDDSNIVVTALAQGIDDASGGNAGQVLSLLQEFPATCFNASVKNAIAEKLKNTKRPHYGELAMLAGYLNTGSETLLAIREDREFSIPVRWAASLALSRMGNEQALTYCTETVKKLPVGSDLVSNILPDLIYTRQRKSLDYCVELLYDDKKLCRSANPYINEKIACAYFIIELLAPVVEDFPIKVDKSIGLESDNYPATLKLARNWFKKNKNYKIKNNTY
jgi:hypothetical protein